MTFEQWFKNSGISLNMIDACREAWYNGYTEGYDDGYFDNADLGEGEDFDFEEEVF